MGKFLLRRLAFFVFTLFLTSIFIFALTRILPGDVARVMLGREATEQDIAQLEDELGLNQSIPAQYVDWATDFFQGDLGRTFSSPRQPIGPLLADRLITSGRLALITLIIAVPLSIGLGVAAGLNEGEPIDSVISVMSLSVVSLPEFVTGLFLINVVALGLQNSALAEAIGWWFPASLTSVRADTPFFEALPALLLPAVTATFVLLAYVVRLTRAGVIEELKREYVTTAIFKGIPYRQVVWRHVLRNALIPTITVIATSTGWLISGLVVIEVVFSYPGLGRLLIFAIDNRDLPLIQAIVMATVAMILVANFTADMLYAVLNPRISLS